MSEIIVVIGESGMGKTSVINGCAGKELGKTGEFVAQTAQTKEYKFSRKHVTYIFLDTIGLEDNREREDLTNEVILKQLEEQLGYYPKDTKIRFIMVQALSQKRFFLHIEAQKYRNVFGPDFLKSSVIVATHLDMVKENRRQITTDQLKADMGKAFNQTCPQIMTFSTEMNEKEQMIDQILAAVAKCPPYSNKEIKKVQAMVAEEEKNQRNETKNPGNFQSKLREVKVMRSMPVTKYRSVTYDTTKIEYKTKSIYRDRNFLGIIPIGEKKIGEVREAYEVPTTGTREESYVDYEDRQITEQQAYKVLKYSDQEIFRKAKDIIAKRMKEQSKKVLPQSQVVNKMGGQQQKA